MTDTGSSKQTTPDVIKLAVIALISAVLGAFITGLFGNGVLMNQLLATKTPTVTPTPTVPDPYLEVTAIEMQTRSAIRGATAIAQLTQMANATATQQYLAVLQTVQANMEATRVYQQAQQQVVTEQARNAEATAQLIISGQQTATTIADSQSSEKILDFADKLSDFPVSLSDAFVDDRNGWAPKSDNGYSVSMKGDVLKLNFSNSGYSPFIWTCDNCGPFNNFSYQIDIKTSKGVPSVIAGILFGSPTRLDQPPFQQAYALSIYSTGAVLLERLSLTNRDTIGLWDHRQDLITPDGEFHTLQVVGIDKYAAIYVDGKLVGDVLKLDYSASGYIGVVTQSRNTDIQYDNLKVVSLP